MVLSCCVCHKSANKNPNLTFHKQVYYIFCLFFISTSLLIIKFSRYYCRFPKDPIQLDNWKQILQLENIANWHRVCFDHFDPNSLKRINKYTTLNKNTVPVLLRKYYTLLLFLIL